MIIHNVVLVFIIEYNIGIYRPGVYEKLTTFKVLGDLDGMAGHLPGVRTRVRTLRTKTPAEETDPLPAAVTQH